MDKNTIKYIHDEKTHNFNAANEIVPFIMNLINPQSVVDVGCGIGTWLKVFESFGVSNFLGIDGNYIDKSLLKIPQSKFRSTDLELPFVVESKFDIAISLEVAEHLSKESAEQFVNSISNLSDIIVFSAAIPNQGGQNHFNEQPTMYWIKLFEFEGYKLFDILRPLFWDNENVDWWYKQNMLIFSKNNQENGKFEQLKTFDGKTLVHPILFNNRSLENYKNYYEKNSIVMGNKGVMFYFALFTRSIFKKISKK